MSTSATEQYGRNNSPRYEFIATEPFTILKRLISVTLAIGLGACSSASAPAYYLWAAANPNTKAPRPPVACNNPDALEKFARLYASGTAGDKQEQATLLGESKIYASDNPPDPPCQRAGHPVGPIQKPGPVDRIKDVTLLSNGVASFKWAEGAAPRPAGQYFTFPEYLVSAKKPYE